ncbi:MarR family winged helix-turn-helix transcriptional regulator [Winogradskya humida]|uniref:Transcriptional regulator n=1 Tax=Winogradskya humida TaxID=113566 RepID=A0ABQ4A577_9ACTN|nr:MarR family transcriptional regulator [Actinoplanes humidus]GIE25992.1 transcriptional regulator [Actinoplanes humidus]
MDAKLEVGRRLQLLLKSVRLIKQHRVGEQPAIPAGLLGMLGQIDELPTTCHARELAVRTSLDPSTVSRAVAALVSHDLVARQPDPGDGRASILVVTPAGRAALADSLDWYARVLHQALAGWSDEDVTAFSDAIDRFARDVESCLTSHDTLEVAQ